MLLQVVSHYALSVASMSVLSFKKVWMDRWVSSIHVLLQLFQLCKAPKLALKQNQSRRALNGQEPQSYKFNK